MPPMVPAKHDAAGEPGQALKLTITPRQPRSWGSASSIVIGSFPPRASSPGLLSDTFHDSGSNPTLYTPTLALHASIVSLPTSTPTALSATPRKYSLDRQIALVIGMAILSMVVGFLAMSVIRSRQCRNPSTISRLSGCWPFKKKRLCSRKSTGNDNDIMYMGGDSDFWRSLVVMDVKPRGTEDPTLPKDDLQSSSIPTTSAAPTMQVRLDYVRSLPGTMDGKSRNSRQDFNDRLQDEEADIAFALNVALRDCLSSTNAQAARLSELEVSSEEDDISTILSLQVGPESDRKRASSFSTRTRPRQGSDASASSQETATTGTSGVFSSGSSRSSMTSMASSESDLDEETAEFVYEVTRAHTRSVEMKKGTLVSWEVTNSSTGSGSMMPRVVVSGPSPDYSPNVLKKSWSLIPSFPHSTSATITTSDDSFLRAPIPSLMVTHPSTASMVTLDSSTSSTPSVDLNDFPLPPVPPGPFFDKKCGYIQPSSSKPNPAPSTVEQFIMMYETV